MLDMPAAHPIARCHAARYTLRFVDGDAYDVEFCDYN
jgi:hypothetical protein